FPHPWHRGVRSAGLACPTGARHPQPGKRLSRKAGSKMRTLLGLTLLTLAALSVFVFAPGGTSSAQVPDTEQAAHAAGPTRGEVCYSVERGHDVKVDARLITDNFGGDRVTIGRLVLM